MNDKVVKRKTVLDILLAFYHKNEFIACLCYFTAYTIMFCLICLVAFQSFYKNGLSFLWNPDGLTQHYNALAYFGEYLRTIVGNFRVTGNFELPMWNFNIGYGSDIITTLHYYVIGDPLCLLSFFVKRQHTETLYNFLIIFRLYLVGISFSIFGIKMKENKFGVFLGTLTYTFCMYALYTCVKHPYFINPMIYFPLLVLGVEKILRKEKPYLFIFMTFISAASNFYFFYMLSILIFLYTVIRFFHKYKKKRLKMLVYHLSHFIVYYLVGVAMSAFLFLPVVIALLSSSRITTKYNINLLYSLTYYENLLPGIISDTSAGYFTFISLSAVAFVSLLLIFFQRKKYTQLKIGILIFTIFLIFPFF
ncbi:MAG: YfhO family protein, partial [Lachnospiraceae bacterium]